MVVMVVVDRAGEARLRVVAVSGRRRSLGGAGEWRGSRRKGRKLCASCGTHAHWFAYSRLSTLPKYNQVVVKHFL